MSSIVPRLGLHLARAWRSTFAVEMDTSARPTVVKGLPERSV
jgi:hypothetical protein